MRLDQSLAARLGLSRNRARFLIESGLVFVEGKPVLKSAFEVAEDVPVEVREDPRVRYVARSALKLAGLLECFPIGISGKDCLDVGSSTGGFVQVLLEHGARSVTGVDVGTDQLHATLRDDPRIRLFERTDIRSWESAEIFPVVTTDVSFISLREVLSAILARLAPGGTLVCLFKPQFEVGREHLRKTGVPKDGASVEHALLAFRETLAKLGLAVRFEADSSLPGEAGNVERLFVLERL